jgi:regulator of protease activity HflC (stomatin/prohibitin superfamily)
VKSAKDFAWFLLAGIVGMFGALWAALSSFARKSSAEQATAKLDEVVKIHDAGAELRAKVAEAKAAKAQAEAEQEKARDTVDVANDLIGGLSAGADKPVGEG